MSEGTALPYPPLHLRERVGLTGAAGEEDTRGYDAIGRYSVAHLERVLGPTFSWAGARVLDFGCGAGRTLRRLVTDHPEAQLFGCDLDGESMAWLQQHFAGCVEAKVNHTSPPLDWPAASFDVIYALSVFTHINFEWDAWLREMHRLLKPDGRLFATFLGPDMRSTIAGEDIADDEVGMNSHQNAAVVGNLALPNILHSAWWVREHWGRLFDLVMVEERGFGLHPLPNAPIPEAGPSHGWVLARPLPVDRDSVDLEAPADDPREYRAAVRARRAAQVEAREIGFAYQATTARLAEVIAERDELLDRLDQASPAPGGEPVGPDPGAQSDRAELALKSEQLDWILASRWWRVRLAAGRVARAALARLGRRTP